MFSKVRPAVKIFLLQHLELSLRNSIIWLVGWTGPKSIFQVCKAVRLNYLCIPYYKNSTVPLDPICTHHQRKSYKSNKHPEGTDRPLSIPVTKDCTVLKSSMPKYLRNCQYFMSTFRLFNNSLHSTWKPLDTL